MKKRHWLRALTLALLVALALGGAALAEADAEASLYEENEYNFVEGSIDVSNGIPADAEGVLANIRDAGVLRVATEPYFPPQEFIDPDLEGQDSFVGADMELARAIAQRMGVELVIVPMEFTKVLSAVAEGECDLAISALAYTPGRASMVQLSKGYYFSEDNAGSSLVIRSADADAIKGVEDLAGRDIVAQSGSLQEAMMAKYLPNYHEFRRLPSMQAVYNAVSDGSADAAMADVESAAAYIANNPDCGLMLLPDTHYTLEEAYAGDRVAGRKGELQLMYFVNGVIDELEQDQQYQAWYDQYEARAAELGM